MTVLTTLNLHSGHATSCRVPDTTPDAYAQSGTRQLIREVPEGTSLRNVERALDLTCLRDGPTSPVRRVLRWADLVAPDGQHFPG